MKVWHFFALSALVMACLPPRKPEEPGPIAGTDPEPLNPPEPEPRGDLFVFVHDLSNIPIARRAARRIENASGIKVHVNEYGTQATAMPIFGSDFLCNSGVEGRAGPYGIALARNCNNDPEMILVHEMLHKLGVGHLELPLRGIMNAATDNPLPHITEDDLNALCAVRPCSVFQPEKAP